MVKLTNKMMDFTQVSLTAREEVEAEYKKVHFIIDVPAPSMNHHVVLQSIYDQLEEQNARLYALKSDAPFTIGKETIKGLSGLEAEVSTILLAVDTMKKDYVSCSAEGLTSNEFKDYCAAKYGHDRFAQAVWDALDQTMPFEQWGERLAHLHDDYSQQERTIKEIWTRAGYLNTVIPKLQLMLEKMDQKHQL